MRQKSGKTVTPNPICSEANYNKQENKLPKEFWTPVESGIVVPTFEADKTHYRSAC